MGNDFEIGRVVAVDTAQVSIELNRDLKGMSRSTYEGPQEVGRINSYVIIPVGARRLVAMVTRVVLVEEAEMKADRTMVALPAARRLMKATLIGTIDGTEFRQGVSVFPVLDSPVHLTGRADLDAIFGPIEQAADKAPNPENPGYCIPLGESTVVSGRPIRINPDTFFGKHAAVLGSTGSGKSCTIASLIQSILKQQEIKRTTFVILDTNGEYRSAFQRQKADGSWEEAGKHRTLYIPSDPRMGDDRLVIPYWFMNAEDFVRLFLASKGVQRPVLLEALRLARHESLAGSAGNTGPSADAPTYFDKQTFRAQHIEQVLQREESGGARARDYCGTMLLRIDRLLADTRFDFLFGPTGGALPNPINVLAAFLCDILGIDGDLKSKLQNEKEIPKGPLPFYDRQRADRQVHHVVIVDLSLLAAEVLENVTALIGRLVLEFLQRLGEHGCEGARGALPVVLVLEEAQNYIQQPRSNDDESISRAVFERIAREGRKYGLSLVVSSQRPSELSKTVLSQCNSFIVHRLQNPEDLRYFKEIVPGIYGPMLDQIPALAPQTALVLGECVPAPALVRIREACPVPRSRDPKFYRYWVADQAPEIDVEAICRQWEGKNESNSKAENDGHPA